VRVRTPSTSAELALMERSRVFQARWSARDPKRVQCPVSSALTAPGDRLTSAMCRWSQRTLFMTPPQIFAGSVSRWSAPGVDCKGVVNVEVSEPVML